MSIEKSKDTFSKAKRSLEEMTIRILKRNKELTAKLSSIEHSKEFGSEDEPDTLKRDIINISTDISTATTIANDLVSVIDEKYPSTLSQDDYQKLKYTQSKSLKVIQQEIELLNKNKAKYSQLVKTIPRPRSNSIHSDQNDDDDHAIMIPKSQIISLDNMVKSKTEQVDNIYKKTLLVNEISKEINGLTLQQEETMESIESNLSNVQENAKETFKIALMTSQQDNKYKINNCYVLIFLLLLIVLMMTYMLY